MKKLVLIFALVGFLFCQTAIVSAQTNKSVNKKPAVTNQHEDHFTKAINNFTEKKYKAAGDQINKVVASLKRKAGKASAETKEALNASIKELEKLSSDVKAGLINDVEKLKAAFERARQSSSAASSAKKTPPKSAK
jgi:hypothetical protein